MFSFINILYSLFFPHGVRHLCFVENAARVVATEINLLNPETIVLGGGVLNMKGFPKDLLEEQIRSCSRKPYPEESLEIYYSKDEVENGVRGAVEYARERS